MCCFAKPVLSVTSTNIFARLLDDGSQYLAYQMKYRSKEPNAMILPLPVALPSSEDDLEFVSLEEYPDFFKHMNAGFPSLPAVEGYGADLMTFRANKKLKVVEVGNFIASFVPTVADFKRLDKQFTIPKATWDLIPAYAEYGFAVFQLKELEGKPHPMAFKFKSRLENKIFFPTIHIHDGEVHDEEEFDHTLYLQSASFDAAVGDYQNRDVVNPATGFARSKVVASACCEVKKCKEMVVADKLLHRKVMKGTLANTDVVVDLSPKAIEEAKGVSQYKIPAAVTSGTIGLAGLGWFFNRRDEVRRDRDQ